MALTPQEELKKLIAELRKANPDEAVKFDNIKVKDFAKAIKKIKEELDRVTKASSELADNFESTTSSLDASLRSLSGIDKILASKIRPELKRLDGIIKNTKNLNDEIIKGYATEKQILNNVLKLKRSINNITSDTKNLSTKEIETLKENLKSTKAVAESQLQIVRNSKEATQNISGFANILSEIPVIGKSLAGPFKDVSEEIENNIKKSRLLKLEQKGLVDETKNLQKIASKVDKRLNAGTVEGIINQAFGMKNMSEEGKRLATILLENKNRVQEINDELERTPSALKSIANKFKEIFKSFTVFGILTKAFITLKDVFKEMDEQSTQLARSLSMGKDEGVQLRNAFNEIAQSSTLTTKELVEGQLAFTKLTGIAGKLSEANLKTLSEVRSQIGSSEEAQKGLISFAHTTGKSYKEISNTVLGTSRISQTQVGLMMDQKEILDEVLKTSSILRIQFGNNADEITKAVVEAKRLGFTLKDIEGVQSNLLNFESSIAAELEAELLTGKELNLEKARYYALQGDIRGLTQEINKNIGSSVEFENMNVIAREAFAKSLGFSADKLAEILITQEQNDKIAKSLSYQTDVQNRLKAAELKMDMDGLSTALARGVISEDMIKSLGKQEQKQIAQLSMQQQFNAAVENMKSIFTSLVQGPAGQFMTSMTKLLDLANNSTFGRIAAKLAMGTGLAVAIGVIAANIIRGATPGTPMFVKEIGLSGGGIGKAISSLAKVIGIIGLITESLSMISDAFSAFGSGGGGAKEFWSGKNIGRMIGGAIGGAIAAPTGIGIPAGIGIGMMVGGMIGNVVSPVESVPKIQNAMGDDSSLTPLHDGGIITKATPAVVHPNEAVVPLDPFYAKLDELIVEVKAIGNMRVVLDDGILIGHMTNGGTKTGG